MKKMKLADVRKELRNIESELTDIAIRYAAYRAAGLLTDADGDVQHLLALAERTIELEQRAMLLHELYPKANQGPKA